jgi:hypothetical protein
MRVLVTVSPRLYREAVASSLQNIRPGIEVRAAPPEDADLELAGFKPHLFIHNDTSPVPEWALTGVRSRVELSYSDGMNARLVAGGAEVGTLRDISTEELLRVVDVAARKRNSRRS